jgi:hypothetical protein
LPWIRQRDSGMSSFRHCDTCESVLIAPRLLLARELTSMDMKPANLLGQKPSRWIALIAIFAILAPTAGPAQSRHPAPEVLRAQVLNLGVGQWIRVREHSGVNLDGQITAIGPRVFQMQRPDAAAPTDVYFADVARIRCGQAEQFEGGAGRRAGLILVGAIFLSLIFCTATKCTKSAAQASW